LRREGELLFIYFARLCRDLEKTSRRTEKTRLLSAFLRSLEPDEIEFEVVMITGRRFPEGDPRVLEIGVEAIWKMIRSAPQTTLVHAPLTVKRVQKAFDDIASAFGEGSRNRKRNLVEALFGQASPLEREYLARVLFGEMRIGVVEGVMEDAIAKAANVEVDLVKRANMFSGNLGAVAKTALQKGREGLNSVSFTLFKPIKPMLAEMSNLKEVFDENKAPLAFEFKFDGARIQAHKDNGEVAIFTRRLVDATTSLPDIVKVIQENVHARNALVEGEVVAVGGNGKPLPFQDLMRRFRRKINIEGTAKNIPLRLNLFDILYLDGNLLFDIPYQERWTILSRICSNELLARRVVTDRISEAERFLSEAIQAGHEGLMAKSLDGTYQPGIRARRWLKIKPADTLDLVIVAADWGSGRRRGWLSNYHLAVRDEENGTFLDVGKTFKGLTDVEFQNMTDILQDLRLHETDFTVVVSPEVVVEVAYNEVQRSSRYSSGFALRFARITRIRDDKSPREIDTIQLLRRLYDKQFQLKSRSNFTRNQD
jgi:DNA ligase 1